MSLNEKIEGIPGFILRPDFFYFLVLGRFLTKVWIGGENKNKNIS